MLDLKVIATFIPRRPGTSHQVGGNTKLPTFGLCSACGCVFGPLPRLARRYCSITCKAKAQATGRRRFHKATRQAQSAQSLVRYHVQVGNLIRPTTCEACGSDQCAIEAAHYNYAEPLRVRWLCRSCHRKWDCRRPKHGTVAVVIEPDNTSADVAEVEEVVS